MWLENTDHPSLDQLRENVDKALKTLNPLYFLHGNPIGYGKVKKSNKAAVKYLRKKDFTFYNEETRTVHCSTCGVMMRQSSIYPNGKIHLLMILVFSLLVLSLNFVLLIFQMILTRGRRT